MENAEIRIVSNEAGEPTAVIVRIELWREIESEETAYLLKSDNGRRDFRSRLWLRNLEFGSSAFDDLVWLGRPNEDQTPCG
jgi:hypothetical protein